MNFLLFDFESGVMASLLGTMPAVLLGGCITLAVVVFTFSRTGKMAWLSLEELAPGPAEPVAAPAEAPAPSP